MMPGRNAKFKSITINEKIYDKFDLNSSKVTFELKRIMEEKQQIRKFASKIKKWPIKVRVYTNPLLERRERRERNV